jgi:hypothetical protein
MGLSFSTRNTQFQDRQIHVSLAELGNAVVAFFWEGKEPQLGTLTITLPDRSSSTLLGERNRQLSLIFGSQLTALTGKMALVSINFPTALGNEVAKVLLDLVREMVGKELDSG